MGLGQSPHIHPGEYGRAWLWSFLAWEFLLFIRPEGLRFGLLDAGPLLRCLLTVLAALAIVLFFSLAGGQAPLASLWPPVPALIVLHLLWGLWALPLRKKLNEKPGQWFEVAAALVLLLGSLVATEGLFRLAGRVVRYWAEERTGTGEAESALPTYRILCVGDSHTRGVGAPAALSYPRQLQRLLEAEYPGARFAVVNAGIPGSNSSDTRLEFERQWKRASYDAVAVWCGVNNLWSLKNVPEHLLQDEEVSRWKRLGWWLSEELGGIRLIRLVQLAWLNLAKDETPATARETSPAQQRQAVARELATRAVRLLASADKDFFDPGEEFTPDQLRALLYLALPELMPSARIEPFSQWISDAVSEDWNASDWTLHGWALMRLEASTAFQPRLRAARAFLQAIDRDPRLYWAWMGLARAVWDLSPAQSAQLIARLEELRPYDPIFSIYRIRLADFESPEKGDAWMNHQLTTNPDEWLYPRLYIERLLERKDSLAAGKYLGEIRSRWGDTFWWTLCAGRTRLQEGRREEAGEWFRRFLTGSNASQADAWCHLGEILCEAKEYELADTILSPSGAWELNDPRVDRCLLEQLLERDRVEQAIEYGQKAVERNDFDPQLDYWLAWAYNKRWVQTGSIEDHRLALKYYEKALARGCPFRSIYSRLHALVPRSRLYLLSDRWMRRYRVSLTEAALPEEAADRQVRERILLYDLESILRQARARGALTILLNYPENRAGKQCEFDEAYRAFSVKRAVPLVDVARLLRERTTRASRSDYFVPDGHPNAAGYAVVAQEVFRILTEQPEFAGWAAGIPPSPPSGPSEGTIYPPSVRGDSLAALGLGGEPQKELP